MLACMRYIGALDRGLVRTLGVPTSRLMTHREQRRCSLCDIIVGEVRFGLPVAMG